MDLLLEGLQRAEVDAALEELEVGARLLRADAGELEGEAGILRRSRLRALARAPAADVAQVAGLGDGAADLGVPEEVLPVLDDQACGELALGASAILTGAVLAGLPDGVDQATQEALEVGVLEEAAEAVDGVALPRGVDLELLGLVVLGQPTAAGGHLEAAAPLAAGGDVGLAKDTVTQECVLVVGEWPRRQNLILGDRTAVADQCDHVVDGFGDELDPHQIGWLTPRSRPDDLP